MLKQRINDGRLTIFKLAVIPQNLRDDLGWKGSTGEWLSHLGKCCVSGSRVGSEVGDTTIGESMGMKLNTVLSR